MANTHFFSDKPLRGGGRGRGIKTTKKVKILILSVLRTNSVSSGTSPQEDYQTRKQPPNIKLKVIYIILL